MTTLHDEVDRMAASRSPARRWAVLAALALGIAPPLAAQSATLPADSIELTDMKDFRPTDGNWRVVGGAEADGVGATALATSPGTGVLVNLPNDKQRSNLFTTWEHGDLDLELDFMMPKGSNSGIYLQGRYEVQLIDSWGVDRPITGDAGGIYHRWDESRPGPNKGYQGTPPRINASRAPGLWQHMHIVFRAPRFDSRGRKVENARFVRVEYNGALIHENVEVTGPTRGPAVEGEAATGPLVIQGDHGPLAFRNIRYRRFGTGRMELGGLTYRLYEGQFAKLPDLATLTPTRQGAVQSISLRGFPDSFAVVYDGTLTVPTAGRYLLDVQPGWANDNLPGAPQAPAVQLSIDGKPVAFGEKGYGALVDLSAGAHPLRLTALKNVNWGGRLTLYGEGVGVHRQALFDENAVPPPPPLDPIRLEPKGEPVLLRSFVRWGEGKRTHAVNVGDPTDVHYTYDLEEGALLQAWRGPFLETTQMWHSRGEDQIAIPRGSVLTLDALPTVAVLPGANAPWPDSMSAPAYHPDGYSVAKDGHPTFLYHLGEVEVEDRVAPAPDGTTLVRQLHLRAPAATAGLYVRLARAAEIQRLGDGSYAVGGFTYYVRPEGGVAPVIRRSGDEQELVVPVSLRNGEATVSYGILW
jgi:hypothetical protein